MVAIAIAADAIDQAVSQNPPATPLPGPPCTFARDHGCCRSVRVAVAVGSWSSSLTKMPTARWQAADWLMFDDASVTVPRSRRSHTCGEELHRARGPKAPRLISAVITRRSALCPACAERRRTCHTHAGAAAMNSPGAPA
jgi:hypothetical protein